MWNKNNERDVRPTAAPLAQPTMPERSRAPEPPPAPRRGGLIGSTMRVKGDIFADEELCIDGQLEGSIESKSRLVIGSNGKVRANVKASEVDVVGSIQGNVEATDKVIIRAGANIVGDVKTSGIVIEDGAYFKGGIDITKPEKQVTTMPPRTAAVSS